MLAQILYVTRVTFMNDLKGIDKRSRTKTIVLIKEKRIQKTAEKKAAE